MGMAGPEGRLFMDDIRITIPAVPVAQPRPRAAVIAGHVRITGNPIKHAVTAFKATCRLAASEAYRGPPLDGPLALSILFVMPRLQSSKVASRVWHDKRPDFDNLAKSCTDALTGLLWCDDNQLCEVRVVKVRAAVDEAPHVELTIWKAK